MSAGWPLAKRGVFGFPPAGKLREAVMGVNSMPVKQAEMKGRPPSVTRGKKPLRDTFPARGKAFGRLRSER